MSNKENQNAPIRSDKGIKIDATTAPIDTDNVTATTTNTTDNESVDDSIKLPKPIDERALAKAPKDEILTTLEKAVKDLETASKLAKVISKTKFAENFKTVDDDNNVTIKEEDIVAAILFGAELGLTPMKALSLGSELNKNAYYAIQVGRNLGLNEITAMKNVHCFSTRGGMQVYVGIHVINKVLKDTKTDVIWKEDFEPHYWYTDTKSGEDISRDEALSSKYHIVLPTDTKAIINKAIADGKRFVKRRADRVTSAVFKREGFTDLTMKYYLSDAIEAGLYKGIKSDGTESSGKDNWNNYPRRQMRNRVIITGGREMVPDKLFDTYSYDEISSINPKAASGLNDPDVEDAEFETVS